MLELAIARALFDRFPEFTEGRMAKVRSHVVSRASCAVVSRELGLGERLKREASFLPTDEVNKVTVRKPDGSVCYTLEWTCACQFQCEGAVTWKDPAGRVVATGTTSVAAQSMTCAGSGETASASCGPSPSEPGCNPWPAGVLVYGYLNLPQSCDPGSCP